MKREIDLVLDARKKLLLRLVENPKEFDKLPEKGLLLPREKIIVPYRKIKRIGEFLVLPKEYSIERLVKKNHFLRK